MSSALKVIKQLLNDLKFRAKNFTVVYLDSAAGLLERPLQSFSWNFEADFGWCPFVVPGWQIVDLKYESRVVWNNVLDQSIDQVQRLCSIRPKGSYSKSGTSTNRFHNCDEIPQPVASSNKHSIITPFLEEENLSDVFWYQPSRPNFFICQRVSADVFHEKAVTVQDEVCKQNEQFRNCLYTPEMFHLTLCTLSLSNLEEVKGCFSALQKTCESAIGQLPCEPLEMISVDTFGARVLYVGFQPNVQLSAFVTRMSESLRSTGYRVQDTKQFTPHITLMKLNGKQRHQMKIDTTIVKKFAGWRFGTLHLREFHLCLMGSARDRTGFYRSYGRITLSPSAAPTVDKST